MGIGHKVLFTGFLRGDDVEKVFKMADLYVMPSVSEPFGIAPLEAMSHDVPVIISKQSGVPRRRELDNGRMEAAA
jgi:glycogen(starch) synthase